MPAECNSSRSCGNVMTVVEIVRYIHWTSQALKEFGAYLDLPVDLMHMTSQKRKPPPPVEVSVIIATYTNKCIQLMGVSLVHLHVKSMSCEECALLLMLQNDVQ